MIKHGWHKAIGFNLIELLIVLLIISLLVSVMYPSYHNYKNKTEQLIAQQFLLSLMQAQRLFYSQHHTYTQDLKNDLNSETDSDHYRFAAQACEGELIQHVLSCRQFPMIWISLL